MKKNIQKWNEKKKIATMTTICWICAHENIRCRTVMNRLCNEWRSKRVRHISSTINLIWINRKRTNKKQNINDMSKTYCRFRKWKKTIHSTFEFWIYALNSFDRSKSIKRIAKRLRSWSTIDFFHRRHTNWLQSIWFFFEIVITFFNFHLIYFVEHAINYDRNRRDRFFLYFHLKLFFTMTLYTLNESHDFACKTFSKNVFWIRKTNFQIEKNNIFEFTFQYFSWKISNLNWFFNIFKSNFQFKKNQNFWIYVSIFSKQNFKSKKIKFLNFDYIIFIIMLKMTRLWKLFNEIVLNNFKSCVFEWINFNFFIMCKQISFLMNWWYDIDHTIWFFRNYSNFRRTSKLKFTSIEFDLHIQFQ